MIKEKLHVFLNVLYDIHILKHFMEVLNSTYKCTHTSVQKYNHNQCNWNF